MDDSPAPAPPAALEPEVVLSVPEIRDYRVINQEVVRLLDQGCRSIWLAGTSGQRLLVAGLAGTWGAVVVVQGDAGPELAAGLDAPAVTVACLGSAADGGASGLRAGRVLVLGDVGSAFGYAQRGGLAIAAGTAGPRAGLAQRGGDLVLLGRAGPLAGERQAGGRLFLGDPSFVLHAGRGRWGGRLIRIHPGSGSAPDEAGLPDEADRAAFLAARRTLQPWLPTDCGRG